MVLRPRLPRSRQQSGSSLGLEGSSKKRASGGSRGTGTSDGGLKARGPTAADLASWDSTNVSAISKKTSVPEFLLKLYRILQTEDVKIIEWESGCIHVKNPQVLGSEILHRYFRHSKYSSFQRQLNYFGFRKTQGKGKMSPCTYTNDELRGGPLRSLLNVKRKSSGNPKPSHAVAAVSSSESEGQGEEEEEDDDEEEVFSEGDTSTDDGYYYYGRGPATKRHRGISLTSSTTAPQGEEEDDRDLLTSAAVLSDEESAAAQEHNSPQQASPVGRQAMGRPDNQGGEAAGTAEGHVSVKPALTVAVNPAPILTGQASTLVGPSPRGEEIFFSPGFDLEQVWCDSPLPVGCYERDPSSKTPLTVCHQPGLTPRGANSTFAFPAGTGQGGSAADEHDFWAKFQADHNISMPLSPRFIASV